ncbi:MAG: D-alanine--D-alanine ligase [Deltaproteobacteria bacterium]|nr:D-alanine--D-alanine ligase [Deltaproteobacteria bacterium]
MPERPRKPFTGRVAVVREAVTAQAGPDAQDTLIQAEAVCRALSRATCAEIELGDSLPALETDLRRFAPDVVFNLVESHDGQTTLACVAPALYRRLGLPFTGNEEAALLLAGDKAAAARIMNASGILTPPGLCLGDVSRGGFPGPGTYIVKSRFEDASVGLDENCVVAVRTASELVQTMRALAPAMGGDCVAEKYVDGREFNLALLGGPGKRVCVLPVAEMLFDPAMAGPRILHYAAKWHEGSPAWAASSRAFGLADNDLIQGMIRAGLRCWDVFGLAGYARVDFRVAASGEIHVIDINPNPCLSPDAGFAAAGERCGMDYAELIEILVAEALWRRSGRPRRELQ